MVFWSSRVGLMTIVLRADAPFCCRSISSLIGEPSPAFTVFEKSVQVSIGRPRPGRHRPNRNRKDPCVRTADDPVAPQPGTATGHPLRHAHSYLRTGPADRREIG